MTDTLLHDYATVGLFLLAGLLMGLAPVVIPLLIGPRSRGRYRGETYESGVETVGSAWIQFSISFYLFALIFVAFDVDVLYLFPVALVFDQQAGIRDLVEVVLFIGILSLAIVYAWRKGVFLWK